MGTGLLGTVLRSHAPWDSRGRNRPRSVSPWIRPSIDHRSQNQLFLGRSRVVGYFDHGLVLASERKERAPLGISQSPSAKRC